MPSDPVGVATFLVLATLGSLFQAFSGFALGLTVVGLAVIFHALPIGTAASLVALVTLVNASGVLLRGRRAVHAQLALSLSLGLLPGTILGLWLLGFLQDSSPQVLTALLALVIISTGMLLLMRTEPWRRVRSGSLSAATGFLAGVIGGLFGAPAPPLVYFLYRQPLSARTIRTTLVAIFAIAALSRTAYETLAGMLTIPILLLALVTVPVVLIGGWLGDRLAHRVARAALQRYSSILLLLLGVVTLASSFASVR